MKREVIRVEPLSTYLDRWTAPTSAAARCAGTVYVSGLPPFDPATGPRLAGTFRHRDRLRGDNPLAQFRRDPCTP